ncbi:MAG: hypothetical protein QOF76_2674 [Solirubrobacteraceae bacterium]|jgi:hypothetical protein|nr:hypothetical protein [Solirubrobacteraceae bacterium]
MIRRLAPVAAVLALGLGASAPAYAPKPKTITGTGIGKIQLGATYKSLHKKGLVGKKVPGCELASPPQKGASLKPPLRGSVIVESGKVTNITVFDGAEVNGVGPGSGLDDVKAAFPNAKVDSSQLGTFDAYFVRVKKADGGPFTFIVDGETEETVSVGIPYAALCD